MNCFRVFAALAAMLVFAVGHSEADVFVNGGFENGNSTGWTGGGGYWAGSPSSPVPVSNYNGGSPNNSIVTMGVDPIVGGSTVYSGNYAVRLNDSYPGNSVSTLRQSVTNYTANDIYFAWKAVLQDSHGLYDSDYFSLAIHDDTTNADVVSRSYSSAGTIGAGASNVQWRNVSDWKTSGWVVEHIDVAGLGLVGHSFTVTALASDCAYGGHAGYTYVDAFDQITTPKSQSAPSESGVPEIDPAGMGSVLALVTGALGLLERRRLKVRLAA